LEAANALGGGDSAVGYRALEASVYELARPLCALPNGQTARLRAVTGRVQQGDRQRTYQAGFDEYLTVQPTYQRGLHWTALAFAVTRRQLELNSRYLRVLEFTGLHDYSFSATVAPTKAAS
jgi:hypothetical protein